MRFIFKCSLYFSKTYWKYNWKNVGRDFFRFYGFFWLIVEPSSIFFPEITDWTRGNWESFFVYVALALLCAIGRNSPAPVVSCRLSGRDVSIEIRISNIFDVKGAAFVISTNSTFDTSISRGLISAKSLQGQFTGEYYDKEEHLDSDLTDALAEEESMLLDDDRKGKKEKYEIGTVAKVCPKQQIVYLVAIAHMNKEGRAESTFEAVLESLGKLWNFIAERGELEPLVVPVLGTGLTRLAEVTREEMIKEIIKSFIPACSEKKFCEKLTIVISESDYRKWEIDLHELGNFLRYHCNNTDLKNKTDTGKGKAIP